ncbi:hypothetical protein ACFLZN_01325 [Nanoarchaeota archaeon]
MDKNDEDYIKEKINEIENKCLMEELDVIMKRLNVTKEEAYDFLMNLRDIWEFTSNVSSSGSSLVITLPRKEAKERGIEKGSPVFVAMKRLRFGKI